MDVNRRKTLAVLGSGTVAVGLLGTKALSSVAAPSGTAPRFDEKGQIIHEALPYVKLDPIAVAERAYANYYKGDCMYGVFAAIVEALAEKVGEPFASYPTTVTRYGAGGVLGWASLCGAPNGAAMAIYLVSKDPVPLIDEVYNYYQSTALPDYTPKAAKSKVVPSVAESTLCHASVSNWCDKSGFKSFSPERAERCAQLVASVAKKTVEVLNAQFAGSFKAAFPIPAEVQACRVCHDKGGTLEDTRAKMNCAPCHPDQTKDHP